MADSRTLNDRFARRAAPGGKGFAAPKDPFAAKTAAPVVDAFAKAKAEPDVMRQDAFSPKSRSAKSPGYTRKMATAVEVDAVAVKPTPPKPAPQKPAALGATFVRPAKSKVTPPAPPRSGMTAAALAPTEKIARPKSPAFQTARSTRQKSLMVKPTPVAAEAPKSPMVMLAASGLAAPKPQNGSGFYNPFEQKRPAPPVAPVETAATPKPPRDMFDPDPAFAFEPEAAVPPVIAPETPPETAPEPAFEPEPAPPPLPKRALHVVQAQERPVSAIAEAAKQRPAARASSLVLVSGAGAMTAAAEAAEAPVTEKPPEPKAPEAPAAPVAEKPAAPAAAPPPSPKAEVASGDAFWKGGGGGSGGGGSGKGPGGGVAAQSLARRGFNQDDIFGVVFGIAVLIFLLLWFMRGKGEEASPGDDLLATTQSTSAQSFAALPAPPKADPFGDAPVDLKPSGPIPEAPADVEVAPVAPPAAAPAPAPVAPAVAAPNPEAALPIAERKMHAWFCTASSRLTKPSRTELTGEMAKFADVFKGKELIVRGYADTRGSTELNADLGTRRAQTVADYLTSKGLSVVDVQGVGELEGLDDNQNCPNQRRVDVWVKGGPAETPSRACAPEPEVESLICG